MGLAVDVQFATNRAVYVCASRDTTGTNGWTNQVLRYTVASSGAWSGPSTVLGGMKAATTHNGCSLEMDSSGLLWVGMGDAATRVARPEPGQPQRQGPEDDPDGRGPLDQPAHRRRA